MEIVRRSRSDVVLSVGCARVETCLHGDGVVVSCCRLQEATPMNIIEWTMPRYKRIFLCIKRQGFIGKGELEIDFVERRQTHTRFFHFCAACTRALHLLASFSPTVLGFARKNQKTNKVCHEFYRITTTPEFNFLFHGLWHDRDGPTL